MGQPVEHASVRVRRRPACRVEFQRRAAQELLLADEADVRVAHRGAEVLACLDLLCVVALLVLQILQLQVRLLQRLLGGGGALALRLQGLVRLSVVRLQPEHRQRPAQRSGAHAVRVRRGDNRGRCGAQLRERLHQGAALTALARNELDVEVEASVRARTEPRP